MMNRSFRVRVLKDNDFKTFEQICGLTQKGLKKTMSLFLSKKYKQIIETPDYLLAVGDIPIALVAHLDTVFAYPTQEVYYDRQKNVIFSPEGLGADDRAGVFAIIQIIRSGLRPSIILTTDEEKGVVGASKLSAIECPFKDLRYIIELDRRGANDCVFYDCDNKDFIEYIEEFGFAEAIGSFSDISMICPAWGVAGVNLSIGYRDEHSISEVLFVDHMMCTIRNVKKMLTQENIPYFTYIERTDAGRWRSWYRATQLEPEIPSTCAICSKQCAHDELIPVNALDGTVKYYCIDCIAGRVNWCHSCGEAYEVADTNKNSNLCEDCWYDFHYAY